ncbi:hypothetical protein [Streptomyces sp. KL116D]|uniref:hypothetical protein n=1 Tax=Streptomyces sp. KL116D TaxID=3045152 RepID=UPI00355888D1
MAVLACRVDRVYPRGHAQLIDHGSRNRGSWWVSCRPGDRRPQSLHPSRNRVIAALHQRHRGRRGGLSQWGRWARPGGRGGSAGTRWGCRGR